MYRPARLCNITRALYHYATWFRWGQINPVQTTTYCCTWVSPKLGVADKTKLTHRTLGTTINVGYDSHAMANDELNGPHTATWMQHVCVTWCSTKAIYLVQIAFAESVRGSCHYIPKARSIIDVSRPAMSKFGYGLANLKASINAKSTAPRITLAITCKIFH